MYPSLALTSLLDSTTSVPGNRSQEPIAKMSHFFFGLDSQESSGVLRTPCDMHPS